MPSPATLAFAVTRLSSFDLAIVAVYLLGITLFGLSFRKRNAGKPADKSLKSYFLADNTIPWWAIALSIVSAETSTLTIISIPGVAFAGDFGFLQVVLGYMLGRIVVAGLFLPRYFAGQMLTAYQLIDRRFGHTLHKVTAGLFLVTRAAAEGVRVFAVSIVVGLAIGTGDVLSIGIICLLTLLYTFEGGMAAVVWTDVVQMGIYVGGTFVALLTLGSRVQGGWHYIVSLGQDAGKFHLFNFALNLTTTYTFWAGVLGGTFLTMASHGTDQLMVQRLLAARNLRESRLALLSSGVVIFLQFSLFLLIGVGLWVFYGAGLHTSAAGIKGLSSDRIFPTFIVHEMPLGIAGLLVAAILAAAMSNLSAALNSLSSTTVVDFYMHLRPDADDRERTMISKSSTAVWALVLFAIAVYSVHAGGKGHVVETGLSIASVAYGCLLGVFLLGTLTHFATQWGAITGMIVGFAVNIALWQFPGRSAMHFTIPNIAWTWYVLIGAFVTFAVGSLASLLFRSKPARSAALAMIPFTLVLLSGARHAQAQTSADKPDFSQVSQILNDAIAAHKLPGAVVLIGHGGKVVFEHAYGDRKLAGEPGLDGKPSPAEPMTEDTIFDMASLSKCLATATAIMQLYEAGKLQFDDPVEKYLPEFNPAHDPTRAKVTLRMLLTHFSGEAPDVDLKDPWGLAKPDKAEGIRRALTTALKNTPGTHFEYSDINFILLGDIVEKISGEPEDVYAQEHIFAPLGMTETRYLPVDKACGPHKLIGAAIVWAPKPPGNMLVACPKGDWSTSLLSRIAPTTHDDESKADPAANPHYDMLTRGTVHDPTTRRMGDVAGHAGVFSTAHDMSLFAQAMLDKLVSNIGPFPLKQTTLRLMTSPEQPGHGDDDLDRANAAQYGFPSSIASFHVTNPSYPAVKDHTLRGFGWDVDSAFSKPRGTGFLIGSFGHTGFTGTSLWVDPYSDTYVVLLANAIHPRGNPPISNLRGDVATAAAKVLVHYPPAPGKSAENCVPSDLPPYACEAPANPAEPSKPHRQNLALTEDVRRKLVKAKLEADYKKWIDTGIVSALTPTSSVSTGIDVLESTHAKALLDLAAGHGNHLTLGLLTNQAGLDSNGKRTIDYLHSLTSDNIELTALFSPEHGIFGKQDSTNISAETDPVTGLHVISLYGPHDADKRPSHEQLAKLDAVVIDLQDVGVHYWTYESVLGYFLEAASKEQTAFHHHLDIVVLDRPNPIGGLAAQGPFVDADRTSYVAYMPLPVRHGLTYGELARYIVMAKHLEAPLTVVAMQGWSRKMLWSDTGLPWTNPSPNLRSPEAALLYPALGLIETTNISVGRGTEHPFSFFGAGVAAPVKPSNGTGPDLKTSLTLPNANNSSTTVVSTQLTPDTNPVVPKANTATVSVPLGGKAQAPQHGWFHADEVAMELNARHIPGVTFAPVRETIAEDANHYPFHGQMIEAVRVRLTDPSIADTPEIGIEILAALHRLYPTQFNLEKSMTLVANRATVDAIARGDDPRAIAASWQPSQDTFRAAAESIRLYR